MYLQGKTAVITGISKGIGKSLTQSLLAQGVTVVGWGRTAPDYSHAHLHFEACDIREEASVAAVAARTLQAHTRVDFLINNAGFGYFSPIASFDTARFREMWEVNVWGAFLVTRALATAMQAQRSGHIVNISSVAGRVGMPQGEGYNSSKWALTGMSDCLFQELRQSEIKVTTVFPGSVRTHFFDEIPGASPNEWMLDPDEVASLITAVLNTSPNCLVRELEVRPLNSKAPR